MMSEAKKHACPTWRGRREAGHLCTPIDHDDEACEWCGAMIVNQRHMCSRQAARGGLHLQHLRSYGRLS